MIQVLLPLLPLLACCPAAAPNAQASQLEGERWRAVLEVAGGELPFVFEVFPTPSGGEVAFVFNGEERITVPEFERTGTGLRLGFPHYDSEIEAAFDPKDPSRVSGTWTKVRGANRLASVEFSAARTDEPRFEPRAFGTGNPGAVAGRWRVDFGSSVDPAVGIFEADSADQVRGTFLTETGDYRYLAGRFDGDLLRMSCFDGGHAFLFHARLEPDGSLVGTFDSGNWWQETWSAVRDEQLTLGDPFSALQLGRHWQLASLTFPDLDGRETWLGAPGFSGVPLVVQIFGSWCPNCHDEAALLSQLAFEFGSRVQFVGLAFELTGEQERDAAQVRRYAQRWGLTYPMLLAGTADKGRAAEALGLDGRLISFPTTLFIDANGRVRAVHSGFSGPATGAAHERTVTEIRSSIQLLLDGPEAWPEPGASQTWTEFGGVARSIQPIRGALKYPQNIEEGDPLQIQRGGSLEIDGRRLFRTAGGWRDALDLARGLWNGAPPAAAFAPADLEATAPVDRALALADLRRSNYRPADAAERDAIEARLLELLESAHGPTRREALRACLHLELDSAAFAAARASIADSDPLDSLRGLAAE